MLRSYLILIFIVLAMPSMAAAQPNLLPEGQTLLTFSVTERRSVEQDTLVATLRIEQENRDAVQLQNAINRLTAEALVLIDEAAEDTDIVISTGRYSVYQHQRSPQGNRSDIVWRGSRSLTLETRVAQAQVQALSGELQAMGFVVSQFGYRLSRERADEVRDSLLESAIARALETAERAGRAMGRGEVEIAALEVDQGAPAMPMMRTMSLEADTAMAEPSARAGEQEVTLEVRVQAVTR
jgi:predicted secreted protein